MSIPSSDGTTWFELETDGRTLDPIESQLVITSYDQSGLKIAPDQVHRRMPDAGVRVGDRRDGVTRPSSRPATRVVSHLGEVPDQGRAVLAGGDDRAAVGQRQRR